MGRPFILLTPLFSWGDASLPSSAVCWLQASTQQPPATCGQADPEVTPFM